MWVFVNPKAKITEFGDQQASKIRVRTKYFLIRCTRASNLRDLGTPAGMLRSPKGSPKFLFGRPTLRSGQLKYNAWKPEGLPEIFLRTQPWYVDLEKSSDPEMLYSLVLGLRWAQRRKPCFVTLKKLFSAWLPVKVFKTLNGRQSIFSVNFTKSKKKNSHKYRSVLTSLFRNSQKLLSSHPVRPSFYLSFFYTNTTTTTIY